MKLVQNPPINSIIDTINIDNLLIQATNSHIPTNYLEHTRKNGFLNYRSNPNALSAPVTRPIFQKKRQNLNSSGDRNPDGNSNASRDSSAEKTHKSRKQRPQQSHPGNMKSTTTNTNNAGTRSTLTSREELLRQDGYPVFQWAVIFAMIGAGVWYTYKNRKIAASPTSTSASRLESSSSSNGHRNTHTKSKRKGKGGGSYKKKAPATASSSSRKEDVKKTVESRTAITMTAIPANEENVNSNGTKEIKMQSVLDSSDAAESTAITSSSKKKKKKKSKAKKKVTVGTAVVVEEIEKETVGAMTSVEVSQSTSSSEKRIEANELSSEASAPDSTSTDGSSAFDSDDDDDGAGEWLPVVRGGSSKQQGSKKGVAVVAGASAESLEQHLQNDDKIAAPDTETMEKGSSPAIQATSGSGALDGDEALARKLQEQENAAAFGIPIQDDLEWEEVTRKKKANKKVQEESSE
eukprot:CAMPEP_0116066032 /NCGR_PEP_ID=MMETSP0322-20121206/10134_1 /TAXON_ID=163516 /ORGANISM="Leptocylindrus danicus var. apora, Strain B651" /LENGTH=463 /DNA_ID=CAMNT_0003552495 /DNA_START=108 /DNA_END=1496 /DNA_ORIENTATION=-